MQTLIGGEPLASRRPLTTCNGIKGIMSKFTKNNFLNECDKVVDIDEKQQRAVLLHVYVHLLWSINLNLLPN